MTIVPILFIDGVDLLAKEDKELCGALVTFASTLANCNKLKLILVSSKGSIIPLIEMLSATNKGLVYEIGDIDEH